jgi:hypothetical protein
MNVSFEPAAGADPGPQIPITVENTATPVVVEPQVGASQLASTGADVLPMVGAGLALIAAGVLALAMARGKGRRV